MLYRNFLGFFLKAKLVLSLSIFGVWFGKPDWGLLVICIHRYRVICHQVIRLRRNQIVNLFSRSSSRVIQKVHAHSGNIQFNLFSDLCLLQAKGSLLVNWGRLGSWNDIDQRLLFFTRTTLLVVL